jgi:hypothetical protein
MMTVLCGGAQCLWDFAMELFHVKLLVPRILGRFMDLICVPLV